MSVLLSIGSVLKPALEALYGLQKIVLLSGVGGVCRVKNTKRERPDFPFVFVRP